MLIAINHITFEFGAHTILKDASWHIMPNERIGLIGKNGAGKSTLLRIINKEYTVSEGSVERAGDVSVGFFNQDLLSFETSDSILQVAMTAFERALQLEKKLKVYAERMAEDQSDEWMQKYSEAQHEFEALDGYNLQHKTEAMLEGLGFKTSDLDRPFSEFSGGWRMRVLLARMMLQEPEVLMLDEPTNHLDMPSIEWLERYLQNYKGTVIITSHDRYFLDRMVTKIAELYQQQIHLYSGNYEFYENEKALRIEQQKRAYENQQEYIRQQERFIERFRAKATKAAQAQSAIKRLEKLDIIEEVDDHVETMNIRFNIDQQPGKIITTLKNIHKNFGEQLLLENAEALIARGDRIALIGANGVGKSTLLRIIAGTETFTGQRKPGHNVKTSFYAQHQLEALNLENDLLTELQECGSGYLDQELRGLLGAFLFPGDDVFKKIKVLSGGEKARVALAKTIIAKANFLLLDEPTNHLDIQSVERLIEALNRYEGTYVLVSHNRYFISKTANKIWEIKDQRIKIFNGTYAEWAQAKEEEEKAKNSSKPSHREKTPQHKSQKNTPPTAKNVIDKGLKKEWQKQKSHFERLEKELGHLKSKKKKLEQALADPEIYADKEHFQKTEAEYQLAAQQFEEKEKEYEKAFEKYMELDEQMIKV